MTKGNETQRFKELEPIFRLKPVVSEECECEVKHVDYMKDGDKLGDEVVPINTSEKTVQIFGPNTDYLGKVDGYDVTVNVYRNNITGSYMLKNRNLPVVSLQFMYRKNIVVGYLFDIFIYMSMNSDTVTRLTDPSKYVGARIEGLYTVCLDCDNELRENMPLLNDKIETYSLNDVALKMTAGSLTMTEEDMQEMLGQDIERKRAFYKSLIDGYQVKGFKNMKKFVDTNLIPIYKNPDIIGLVKFALEMRLKRRMKLYGKSEEEYKIPEKTIKWKDCMDDPNKISEYFEEEK